jgi:hypothetical protein
MLLKSNLEVRKNPRLIPLIVMNLVKPKAGAKNELLLKQASVSSFSMERCCWQVFELKISFIGM